MNTQTGRAITLALTTMLLVAMWAYSITQWFELPEEIPMHFGFSGNPTRFADSTLLNWFMLPVITTVLVVFILSMTGRGIRRFPGLINWSNDAQRRAFMTLNDEQREPAFKLFYGIGLWLATYISAQFFYLHYATFQVAAGLWSGLPAPYLLDLIPLISILAVLVVDLNRKLNRILMPSTHTLQEKGYRVK